MLTEDQAFLLETTRRYLAAEAPIPVVRSLEDDPAGFTAAYWRQGCELGWTSLLVADEHGGGRLSEHGLLDLALIAEEMGRRVSPGPLVPVNLVASALSAAGSDDHRASILPALPAGDAVAAWTGPTLLDGVASDDGRVVVVSGTAAVVEAGAQADHLLVAVHDGDGVSQLLVPATTPGVEATPLGSLDLVRRFARVTFADVAVPATALVGPAGGAAAEVERLGQVAAVLGCAEAAGPPTGASR